MTLETKMRVKSPGAGSEAGCCGDLTTWVATWGGASLGWGGAVGRGPMELNISVNSPGRAPGPAGGWGEGADCAGRLAAGGAVAAGTVANGSAGLGALGVSASKALRNMAVALRGSACSGSGPELGFLFGMGGAVLFRRAGKRVHCEAYTHGSGT